MTEEMTTGEIARALRRIEEGQRELRSEISARLDRTVSTELYTVQYDAVQQRLGDLEGDLAQIRADAKEAEKQRVVDRRWWITAIAVPFALLLLNVVIPLLGGSP